VPGTGLGLTVVRRVVQQHGGDVGASGRVGEGARFWWTLPAT
jgi:signal transduction histidine kinase